MDITDLLPDFTPNNQLAVSFRGYNVTNLGQTPKLLDHPLLKVPLQEELARAEDFCAEVFGERPNLLQTIREERPSDFVTYSFDLAMIVAVELAHWRLLQQLLGEYQKNIKALVGYSLGEVTASIVSGQLSYENALRPILELSKDAAALAPRVSMGVLFSRGPAIDGEEVWQHCEEITAEGNGIIAISTYLAPNALLLMGENETVARFKETMKDRYPKATHLRKNPHNWPPLHTPIVLLKQMRDRAAVMLLSTPVERRELDYPILSCVTGDLIKHSRQTRKQMTDWVDHPQQLWKCVHQLLKMGIDDVIHLGPEPNIIPATLTRIAVNVETQLKQPTWVNYGLRTFSRWASQRRWLIQMLHHDAVLLRAPFVKQVVFEDCLLALSGVDQTIEPPMVSETVEE